MLQQHMYHLEVKILKIDVNYKAYYMPVIS